MLTPFPMLLVLFRSLGSLARTFSVILADVETEARPSLAGFPLPSYRVDWL
jgi:hypothetical protein